MNCSMLHLEHYREDPEGSVAAELGLNTFHTAPTWPSTVLWAVAVLHVDFVLYDVKVALDERKARRGA